MMSLARRPEVVGFLAGLKAPFSGLGFLLRRAELWPHAIVPAVVVLVLFGALGFGVVHLVDALMRAIFGLSATAWWAVIVRVLLWIVGIVLAYVVAFALAQPLSGPALDRIVAAREQSLGVPPAKAAAGFFTGMWRSLKVTLASLLFASLAIGLLFLIDVVAPPAAVVTTPLKYVVSALTISWDLLDYPMSLRGHDVRTRIAWFRRHPGVVLGFGLALTAIFIIPCVGLLLLPAGVAGAAELFVRSERENAG